MASTPSSVEASEPLQAYLWDLTAAYDSRGQATPHLQSNGRAAPRLKFDAHRVSLQNLCNTIGADYTLKEGRLEISPPMSTKLACVDRDLMALERQMTTQLPQAQRFEFSGGAAARLVLHFADGSRWELAGTPATPATTAPQNQRQ